MPVYDVRAQSERSGRIPGDTSHHVVNMPKNMLKLVAAATVLAACGDKQLPTSSAGGPPASRNSIGATGSCVDPTLALAPTDEKIKFLIVNLFTGDHEASTLAMWENIKKDKFDGQPIQNHIELLAKWTLEHLADGTIVDPDGGGLLNATTGSVQLLDLVFRCAGEVPTQLPEPPAGFNGLFQMVDPSDADQQFLTPFQDAATFIPGGEGGGALAGRSLLVMVRQPAEVQVNTPFPKLSHTFDVALAGAGLKPGQKLSMLFCPISQTLPAAVYERGVIAHQITAVAPDAPLGAGVEYLDPAEGGTLACDNAIGGSSGLGSPMVAVDPYLETEVVITEILPNDDTPASYGDDVRLTARLKVSDVPANPEVYRNTWVNPDAVYSAVAGTPVVNKTQTGNTNLPMAARIADGMRTPAVTDDESLARWTFPCVDAGTRIATVDFVETLVIGNAPRYGPSSATVSFTVQRRDLTITANDKERQYGDANPALDGELEGVQAQCDGPSSFTEVYATAANERTEVSSAVGSTPIVPDLVFGEDVGQENYNLIRVNGALTIVQRPLEMRANDHTREYGRESALGGVFGERGLVNDDPIVLAFRTEPESDVRSAVGTYAIIPEAVVPDGAVDRRRNYAITPVNGELTITKRPLTVVAADASRDFGEPNPTFDGTVTGAYPGDGLVVSYSSAATLTTPAGTYGPSHANAIVPSLSGPPVGNYEASLTNGTLTVVSRDNLFVSVIGAGTGGGVTSQSLPALTCNPSETGCTRSALVGAGTYRFSRSLGFGTTSYFAGWGGDAASCGTNTTCDVTVGATPVTVTARYEPGVRLHVELTGNPATGGVRTDPLTTGASCITNSACDFYFPPNTMVTLSTGNFFNSVRAPGFESWGIPNCGTANTCTVNVGTTGLTVVANFTTDNPVFGNVQTVGTASGRLTTSPAGIDCTGLGQMGCGPVYFPPGQTIVFIAAPNTGSSVVRWESGSTTATEADRAAIAACGTASTCTITPSGALSIRVVLDVAADAPTITLSVIGAGTGGGVTSQALPALTCNPSETGCTRSAVVGAGTYRFTRSLSFSSTAYFAGWGGDAASCGTNTTCDVTVATAPVTVTARYEPGVRLHVDLTGNPANGAVRTTPSTTGGSCNSNSACDFYFAPNTTVTLSTFNFFNLQRAPGFESWGVPSCGTADTCTVTVGTTDLTVVANFTTDYAIFGGVENVGTASGRLTTSPAGMDCTGLGQMACGPIYFTPGQTIVFTVVPNTGSRVVRWESGPTTVAEADRAAIAACGTASTCTITPSGALSIRVVLEVGPGGP